MSNQAKKQVGSTSNSASSPTSTNPKEQSHAPQPKDASGLAAPTEEAPTQQAPTQQAPTQQAPTQEAPAQEVPAQEVPAQELPAQEAGGGGSSSRQPDFILELLKRILAAKNSTDTDAAHAAIAELVTDEIRSRIEATNCGDYINLFLWDPHESIGDDHATKLYDTFPAGQEPRDILLFINSKGGSVEPAYLISRTCKTLKKSKFCTVIPRQAKSAATLICLGADEIHMGQMSELGPIDPQIGHIPALALSNALKKLSELVSEYPGASSMFADYLTNKLDLRHLGYFERINESAVQYATRLLSGAKIPNGKTPEEIANYLVNHYKDHRFVIDVDESTQIFGEEIVKQRTPEYFCGSMVNLVFDFTAKFLKTFLGKKFSYIGGLSAKSFVLKEIKDDD